MNRAAYATLRREENAFDIRRLERSIHRLTKRGSALLPDRQAQLADRQQLQSIEDDGEFLDFWQQVMDRCNRRTRP